MKFYSQSEFTSWLEEEIKKRAGIPYASIISPSTCEQHAKQILNETSDNIDIPSAWDTGTWKGLNDYAWRIWLKNSALLQGHNVNSRNGSPYSSRSEWSNQKGSSQNPSITKYNNSYPSSQAENGIIKRHNFESSLSKIQAFSKNVPCIPELDKFETDGGLFGWGDHYINGYEMNRYVEKVQDLFRSHNNTILKTIQEFREVYNTFDYLDREYIQGILQTANAAKKASEGAKAASDQAKVSSDQAKAAANKALKNEADIQRDVENLRKLVEKIKSIKEDLSSKILVLESKYNHSINELRNDINQRTLSYKERQMITKLGDIYGQTKHLADIDDLWIFVENHEKTIEDINK